MVGGRKDDTPLQTVQLVVAAAAAAAAGGGGGGGVPTVNARLRTMC